MVRWKKRLAQASGATLGYITNNVPGAFAGWNLAGRAYDYSYPKSSNSMAKRKRHGSTPSTRMSGSTAVSSGRKRRKTISFNRTKVPSTMRKRLFPARRVAKVRTRGTTRVNRSTSNWPIRITKGKRNPRKVKGKSVSVSRKFRAKVKKVIDGVNPDGFFKETHFGTIELDQESVRREYGIYTGTTPGSTSASLLFTQDKQWIFGRTSNGQWNFQHFTLEKFIDACQVLFFNKIGLLKDPSGNAVQNSEFRHTIWPMNYNSEAAMSYWHALLDKGFKVKNSYVEYVLRNNTRRQYKITMVKASPKYLKSPPIIYNAGAYVPQHLDYPAINEWFKAMEYENQGADPAIWNTQTVFPGGVTRIGIAGTNGASTVGYTGTNTIGNTPNQLGTSPAMSPMWNSQWKFGYKKFVLESGQEIKLFCQGPKNVWLNPKKWSKPQNPNIPLTDTPTDPPDGPFLDYPYNFQFERMKPGWSEDHFFIIEPELLPTGVDNGAGIFGDIDMDEADDDKLCIAVQCARTYTIECPDHAGTLFDVPLTGNAQTIRLPIANNNKKKAYYVNAWRASVPDPDDPPKKVEELNPVELVTISNE